MPTVRRFATPLLLGVVLLLGAGLRSYNLDWDDGHHLHPDERFLAIVGDRISFPTTVRGYFDTSSSPLNPYNRGFDGFAYGTAPLFATRAVAEALGMAGYDRIHLVGRALSATADLGTIVVAFLLARLLYGTAVGLLAAALLATTVLHIQLSHFFAVDTFLALATTLALYAAYRAWLFGGTGNFALLGLALGLGLATKLSAALLAPIVGLLVLVPAPGTPISFGRRAGGAVLAALVALLAYRVGDPYSFTPTALLGFGPNEQRFGDLNRWVQISSGRVDVPYMIQWVGTPNPWFALRGLVQWGFGLPLGLAALAGLGYAGLEMRRWRARGIHLLVVAWCLINLLYFGFQFAKFLRYLLPVYPALAIVAAYGLMRAAAGLSRRLPRLGAVGTALPVAVLGATALYALAFSSIYTRPNTRVAASEWIYENVQPGSRIAVEHWDDPLPLRLPGQNRELPQVTLELYADESPDKAARLAEAVQRADYLVLSSDRLSGSIPRLPRRFPIAIEYYRLLFEGELGFDLVARFESRPSLGGVTIDDSAAQEDFSVYDHPTVLVYRKTERFSSEATARRLAAVPLDQLERTPLVGARSSTRLLLAPNAWERVQAGGTWASSFSLDGVAARFALPLWVVAVELIALSTLPLCWWLFPGLPDRGLAVAKTLGLLLVSYLAWLAASVNVLPFGRLSVLGCLALVGGLSWAILARRGAGFMADLRAQRRALILSEVVFLGAFAGMLLIRAANPDLWHPTFGGEKPMDFAYLNGVVKSPSFPPYDPWFAGGYVNYYYFGFVLAAVIIHLSAVPPSVAYNLAVATMFGLAAATAFSIGSALVTRGTGRAATIRRAGMAAGGMSATAVCVLGNLDGAVQIRDRLVQAGGEGLPSVLPILTGLTQALAGLVKLGAQATLPPFDFWRSTRFIGPEEPGPIHEFPFFTFLYGDLHAHMIALPLQVTTIAIALQMVRTELFAATRGGFIAQPIRVTTAWARAGALACLAALVVGALRATNTWDFPVYLAISAVAAALMLRPRRRLLRVASLGIATASAALLYGLSAALFAPYLAAYELFYSGVLPARAVTDPRQFLTVHGLQLFAVGSWLALALARAPRLGQLSREPTVAPAGAYYGIAVPIVRLGSDLGSVVTAMLVFAALLTSATAGFGTLAVLLGLAGLTGGLALMRRRSREALFVLVLAAGAIGALALPELVAIQGDVGRMNTVFKFYLQAWVLLGVIAGPAVVWATRRLGDGGVGRAVWMAALACLVAGAAVYPLAATPVKVGLRFTPLGPGLDGMAFMAQARHAENGRDLRLPADYAAIRWMLENVEGTPVVLEGQAPLYHWGSRVSVYTGLPTVLGWDWHQKQQRWGYQSTVEERQRDVKTAYESISPSRTWEVLRRYGVNYVVVGGLERAYYPAAGLAKFEAMVGQGLEVAYRADEVTIYRVVGG